METFIINGGIPLRGTISLGGAKNVALKLMVASLLTDEAIVLHNVPLISDVYLMLEVLKSVGVLVELDGHTVRLKNGKRETYTVPLELGARLRTSSMVLGPLLVRYGHAIIPNPGGCRIGARPIDRHIEGLEKMGARIDYDSDDGFFHAKANGLVGVTYTFPKNTHTGTETLLLAAVLARGTTILENAAAEVEVDDLISFLTSMGAHIVRSGDRQITIHGKTSLHGTEFTIPSDRNEEVTFAVASAVSGGSITVSNSVRDRIASFLEAFTKAGGVWEAIDDHTTTYSSNGKIRPLPIVTAPYPGFMTDWQAPWAVLMTQAIGIATIHETVFESRFSYVSELRKMGAHIDFYDPHVRNPEQFYNFNWNDRVEGYHQGIRIEGPTKLHNAILDIDDLRAGATLVLAALAASGESYIHGVEQIDRGYEKIEERLSGIGARIVRVKE